MLTAKCCGEGTAATTLLLINKTGVRYITAMTVRCKNVEQIVLLRRVTHG